MCSSYCRELLLEVKCVRLFRDMLQVINKENVAECLTVGQKYPIIHYLYFGFSILKSKRSNSCCFTATFLFFPAVRANIEAFNLQ